MDINGHYRNSISNCKSTIKLIFIIYGILLRLTENVTPALPETQIFVDPLIKIF